MASQEEVKGMISDLYRDLYFTDMMEQQLVVSECGLCEILAVIKGARVSGSRTLSLNYSAQVSHCSDRCPLVHFIVT